VAGAGNVWNVLLNLINIAKHFIATESSECTNNVWHNYSPRSDSELQYALNVYICPECAHNVLRKSRQV
jgi:hypothetical protein